MKLLEYIYQEVKQKRLSVDVAAQLIEQFKPVESQDHGKPASLRIVNTSDMEELRFSLTINADEFFVRDHVVNGTAIVPAAAQLDIAYKVAAVFLRAEQEAELELYELMWIRPIVLSSQSLSLHMAVLPLGESQFEFELYSGENEQHIYFQGKARKSAQPEQTTMDIESLSQLPKHQSLQSEQIYQRFSAMGIDYGASQQGIEMLALIGEHQDKVLANIRVPACVQHSASDFVVHPALFDSALQASIGLALAESSSATETHVPFALASFRLLDKSIHAGKVLVEFSADSQKDSAIRKVDLSLSDDGGAIFAQFTGFSSRGIATNTTQTLVLAKQWQTANAESLRALPQRRYVLVIGDVDSTELAQQFADLEAEVLPLAALAPADSFIQLAEQVFSRIQQLLQQELTETVLVQLILTDKASSYLALASLLKTAAKEHSRCATQIIGLSAPATVKEIANISAIESTTLDEEVMYASSGARQVASFAAVDFSLDEQLLSTSVWRDQGVYIISGGAGALGLMLARHCVQSCQYPSIVLLGRSALAENLLTELDELRLEGANIVYQQLDIEDANAVQIFVSDIQEKYKKINGIIHCAGVVRDSLITKKSRQDFETVLAVKCRGLTHLDVASRHLSLDFFVAYSSIAAVVGNPGQSDYAVANAYMDNYMRQREQWRQQGERQGKSLSINWPLWQSGKMSVDKVMLAQLNALGMELLPDSLGCQLLDSLLADETGEPQAVILHGKAQELLQGLMPNPKDVAPSNSTPAKASDGTGVSSEFKRKALSFFKSKLSSVVKMPPERIDSDTPMERFGIDSIMVMELNQVLEIDFGELPRTLFFEVQTVRGLTDYFIQNFREKLNEVFGETVTPVVNKPKPSLPETTDTAPAGSIRKHRKAAAASLIAGSSSAIASIQRDIAIIGIHGRYPQSEDLQAFWDNLTAGKDCIEEVPAERWDYRQYFHPDKHHPGTTYSKWGGFISGVDEFDPLFFNIAPREAQMMDPQERLFLQSVYSTLEDAGYTPASLINPAANIANVGVFVGVMYEEYQLYGAQAQALGQPFALGGSAATIANRVSYIFNFQGPSLALDTMCSSSITSVHLACDAIRQSRCDVAVAGGVNVTIHPNKYLMLSQGKFTSSIGKCESFGEGGDGYVPGEGVGSVLLKPLAQAEADNDHIYAVIKGSAVNHGGKTNGYTVPNPLAQGAVIEKALQEAGVKPEDLDYIEAHGTGTSLGDPIEISGLSKAFAATATSEIAAQSCIIGSVKSNIGHLESAAGIAGISKVVLQLQHQQIVPSLHSHTLNPNINFTKTPFKVQQSLTPWPKKQGYRLAGVSSFGAGGSNAHIILQEYPQAKLPALDLSPVVIVLSAKSEDKLQEIAVRLSDAVNSMDEAALAHVAYTLQVGREEMPYRFAAIVKNMAELKTALQALSRQEIASDTFQGYVAPDSETKVLFSEDEELQEAVSKWLTKGKYSKLMELWVKGLQIDWSKLYQNQTAKPQRVSLPSYPFAKERYWIDMEWQSNNVSSALLSQTLHPLVQRNESDAFSTRFVSSITPEQWFLTDHQIQGEKVLPGVCYLEMAREAVATTLRTDATLTLQDVLWPRPLKVLETAVDVEIEIQVQDEYLAHFSIWHLAAEHENEPAENHLKLCEGKVLVSKDSQEIPDSRIMLAEWESVCSQTQHDAATLYQNLQDIGLNYGPSHRGIQWIKTGIDANGQARVLAEIDLPESLLVDVDEFDLHPGLLDSALQASFGLAFAQQQSHSTTAELRVPFAVDEVTVLGTCRNRLTAMIGYSKGSQAGDSVEKLDIYLVDQQGELQVSLRGFSSRVMSSRPKYETALFSPQWTAQQAIPTLEAGISHHIIWLGHQLSEAELSTTFSHNSVCYINLPNVAETESVDADQFERVAKQLLTELARCLAEKNTAPRLIQLVVSSSQPEWSGLAGMMKTATQEQPGCRTQTVLLPAVFNLEQVSESVRQDALDTNVQEIRYLDSAGQQREVRELHELTSLTAELQSSSPWRERGVYLITGGAGGLGIIVAKDIAQRSHSPTLYLVGRSSLSQQQQMAIEQLVAEGAEVVYRQVDIGEASAVERLVNEIKRNHSTLHGVIHSAGVTKDNFISRKTSDELAAVLAAKVAGIVNLDKATEALPLDVFIGFSSLAALYGNIGQADYAAANGFMDAYLVKRADRVLSQGFGGLSLSINWPLWADGGMQLDAVFAKVLARSGIVPLTTQMGLSALNYAMLNAGQAQVAVLSGDIAMQRKAQALGEELAQPETTNGAAETNTATLQADDDLYELSVGYFKALLSGVLKLAPERIDESLSLEHYGIDSVMVMELTMTLEDSFGALPKTLFYEVQSLAALTHYFIDHHNAQLQAKIGVNLSDNLVEKSPGTALTPSKTASKHSQNRGRNRVLRKLSADMEQQPDQESVGDIAIIGVAGRYPEAEDIDQFWDNLTQGKDCITEVPASRWDIDHYYHPDKTRKDRMYLKWGGFIESFDQFDPKFFNISPREARIMDPQERVFMECVHHAMEDAGYTRNNIGRSDNGFGAEVGVFVGGMYEEYQLYGAEEQAKGNPLVVPGNLASIANRVSYIFDFHGPSLTVDTMCSSSLTSLHLACQSLREEQCNVAVVGGVNLTLHPNKYLMLSQGQFVSSKGRCESFGEGGDGYVPGEGVGAVLLKPLLTAENDGDQIYAVIKSTSLNHGGKTNGYTVPNPIAQGKVIAKAFTKAKIDPQSVSYIEAHGTGTVLGDPIEISGLSKGFSEAVKTLSGKEIDTHFSCAIGSVKSNIGHLESAAGIAGITKILLQFKHNQLVPSIHSAVLNQNIDFENLPFYVQQQNQPWVRETSDSSSDIALNPRRACISSFGAGGSNAHVILEDYVMSSERRKVQKSRPDLQSLARIFVLSAASEEQVIRYAQMLHQQLVSAFERGVNLAQVASILQTGRENQRFRFAFIALDEQQVLTQLKTLINAEVLSNDAWLLDSKNATPAQAAALTTGQLLQQSKEWAKSGQVQALAEAWARGCNVDWDALYAEDKPQKISLPRYPFAHKRYWLPLTPPTSAPPTPTVPAKDLPSQPVLEQHSIIPTTTQQQATVATAIVTAEVKEHSKERQPMSPKQPTKKVSLTPLDSHVSSAITSGVSERSQKQSVVDYLVSGFARLVGKDIVLIDKDLPMVKQGLLGPYSDLAQVWASQIEADLQVNVNAVRFYDYPTIAKLAKHIESLPAQESSVKATEPKTKQWVKLEPITEQVVASNAAQIVAPAQAESSLAIPASVTSTVSCEAVEDYLVKTLAEALLTEESDVEKSKPFVELGLDSIIGVEWMRVINETYQLNINATLLYDNPNIHSLALKIHGLLVESTADHQTLSAPQTHEIAPVLHSNQQQGDIAVLDRPQNIQAQAATHTQAATQQASQTFAAPVPAISIDVLETFLVQSLAEALLLEVDDIDRDKPFVELGLDSIIGVEWVRAINETYHINLNAVLLYENPNIKALAVAVADIIADNSKVVATTTQHQVSQSSPAVDVVAQAPVISNLSTTAQQPSVALNDVEQQLTVSFAEALLLEVDEVELDRPFVEMGLDSIVGVEWVRHINERYGIELNASKLYDNPNIKLLAAYVTDEVNELSSSVQSTMAAQQSAVNQPALTPVNSSVEPSIWGLQKEAQLDGSAMVAEQPKPLTPSTPETPTTHHDAQPVAAQSPIKPLANVDLSANAKPQVKAGFSTQVRDTRVAVIGMSGRYPNSPTLADYWKNLQAGNNCVTKIPANRWSVEDNYCHWMGSLTDVEYFDAPFFAITEDVATVLDPQQRIFLQEAYKAFEDAGYSPQRLNAKKCGVYFGIMQNDYDFILQEYCPAESANGANSLSIAASRLSYFLNLKGPAIPIDTACSSSLVGVHLACQSIANGETDMALVGGATLYLSSRTYAGMCRENMLSADGRCKAFDNGADGFVPGEGVGALVLKRFVDAEKEGDPIYGVIIGSGVNQDGKTNGHAAPSMSSQRELIQSVYGSHNIPPESVSYIEMHGTGTKLGDSIEVQALSQAFAKSGVPKQSCAIGSVKSNIGHTAAAAGVAAIQKVLLAMKHQYLPPTLHVQQENDYCDLANSPLFVHRQPAHWSSNDGTPLRAGVSAFGISGTNAHIVLESYCRTAQPKAVTNQAYVLVLSAKSMPQLLQMSAGLASYIADALAGQGEPVDSASLAFTLQEGRAALNARLALVFSSLEEARDKLLKFQRDQQDGAVYSTLAKGQPVDHLPELSAMIPAVGLDVVARAWVQGRNLDWKKLYKVTPAMIHAPGYVFKPLKFWVDTTQSVTQPVVSRLEAAPQNTQHSTVLASPTAPKLASETTAVKPQPIPVLSEPEQPLLSWSAELTQLCAELLSQPPENLDVTAQWNVLGFDSMRLGLLCNRLNALVETNIQPTVFFEFVNIQELSQYLTSIASLPNTTSLNQAETKRPSPKIAPIPSNSTLQASSALQNSAVESVAIVGLSAAFPMANSLDELWHNFVNETSSIAPMASDFWQADDSQHEDLFAATLATEVAFDCSVLRIAPAQFVQLSRKQKLLMKQTLLAVEDAGYSLQKLSEQNVGVFVGSNPLDVDLSVVNAASLLSPSDANLLSRVFDVNGPSEVVDCGSATTIAAIDKASQALMSGVCEIAIVACANVFESQHYHAALAANGLLRADKQLQLFEKQGRGYVRGEGVAVFVLKKLSVAEVDQDNIHAAIAASAFGHSVRTTASGSLDVSMLAGVIAKTYQKTGISPDALAYVELDARGINQTDSQELQGLQMAYQYVGAKENRLRVGSAKHLMGHAEHAAGALSLIKVLLQIKHKTLLSSFSEPQSAAIDSRFAVDLNAASQHWSVADDSAPRRAAINSFDITGANAHLIVEEYVAKQVNGLPETSSENLAIILLSAKSLSKLQSQAKALAQFLRESEHTSKPQRQKLLNDVAYTSQVGRDAHQYRLAIVANSLEEAIRKLSQLVTPASLRDAAFYGDTQNNQSQHALFQDIEIISEFLGKWIAAGDYLKLVKLWVSGIDIQWENLYGLPENTLVKGQRISMPGSDLSLTEKAELTIELTPTERTIAQVWEKVLQTSVTSKQESFYELGGHFFLLPELKEAFKQHLNQALPEHMWQESLTLQQMASKLDQFHRDKSELLKALQPTRKLQDLPLCFAQNAYWFFYAMDGQGATYNLPCVISLKGNLNLQGFEASLRELIARQESLRTQLYQSPFGPKQRVINVAPQQALFELKTVTDESLHHALAEEVQQPLNLTQGLPIRTTIWRLCETHHVASFVFHHATMDGWSIGIFLKELAALYASNSSASVRSLPELAIQYRDYAVWQNEYLSGVVYSNQLDYWKQKLSGLAPMLNLPTDYARPAEQSYKGAKIRFMLPEILHAQLKDFCRNHSFTLFNTLLSGLALLLSRYCRTHDIPVGTASGNRSHMALENVIGCFANTLPLRCTVDDQQGFADLVANTSNTSFEAFQHADVPFDAIVGAVAPKRSLGVPPIFQVMFRLHNQDMGMDLQWHELDVQFFEYESQVAELDLNISLIETSEGLVGEVAYATDLFAADTISRLIQHYQQILTSVMENHQTPLTNISLLSPQEREQVFAWNQTSVDYPKDQCLHALFEQSVQQFPDKIAYICGDEEYSYTQLNEKANKLAHWLIAQGAGPEVAVGVSVSRSPWMAICALAAFKAGAIYVPLDPNYPADRLDHMLDVAKPKLILSETALMQQVFQQVSIPVIGLDNGDITWEDQPSQNPPAQPNAEHSAYILFTSGSTGKPKGILVAHKSFRNMYESHRAWNLVNEDNVILQFASLSFSISLWGSFMAWAGGGKLVQVTDAESLPDEALYKLIKKHEVTIATWPVSLLTVLPVEKIHKSLRTIISSAEPCNDAVVERWVNSGRRFLNMYGNSEVSLGSTMYEYKTLGQKLTIGKPFPNTQMYILDDNLQPVPPGVVAEIYTGGVGLAKAYYGNPVATAKKFIADPFHPEDPEARLYSTGDLGRYLPNGEIEFIGREDFQVSIRGFRVELTEIEGVLRTQARIADVAVVATPDKDGVDCLTCFYVTTDQTDISAQDLRAVVAKKLPNYMVPNMFIRLESMPLTPNRKVDRLALPGLITDAVASVDAEPEVAELQDSVEQAVAEVWRKILRVKHIPAHADFFNIGGHSLLALQLIENINQRFSVSLPVTTLFSASTIYEQAQLIKSEQNAENHSPLILMQASANAKQKAFLVPGAGGSLFNLYELAKSLGDEFQVYGLQALGLRAGETILDSVEDIARENVAAIQAEDSDSPLTLIGHSFGGWIVFEMAKQLQQCHREVRVVLLDSPTPNAANDRVKQKKLKTDSEDMLTQFIDDLFASSESSTQNLSDTQLEMKQRVKDVALAQVSIRYRPKAKLTGIPCLNIIAQPTEGLSDGLDFQWSRLLEKHTEVSEVNADHFGMLSGESAVAIAQKVKTLSVASES